MPVYIIRAPNGQDVEMTADKPPTDAQKAAIFKEAGLDAPMSPAPPKDAGPSDGGALALSGAAKSAPVVQTIVDQLATNPGVQAAGRNVGSVAGFVKGVATGNPLTTLGAMDVGERAGGRLAAGAQNLALKASPVLSKLAPFTQALSTLSGAQGVNDLAQMAEPDRKDIGFLGVGGGAPDPNHPALLNLIAGKVIDAVKSLVDKGMSEKQAVMTVLNLRAKGPQ